MNHPSHLFLLLASDLLASEDICNVLEHACRSSPHSSNWAVVEKAGPIGGNLISIMVLRLFLSLDTVSLGTAMSPLEGYLQILTGPFYAQARNPFIEKFSALSWCNQSSNPLFPWLVMLKAVFYQKLVWYHVQICVQMGFGAGSLSRLLDEQWAFVQIKYMLVWAAVLL